MNCHSKLLAFFGTPISPPTFQPAATSEINVDHASTLSNFFGTCIKSAQTFPCTGDEERPCLQTTPCLDETKRNCLAEIIEQKVAKKTRMFFKNQSKRKKTWRPKSSQEALQKRYLQESYVSTLLMCQRHPEYDAGKRKICSGKCKHDCQQKFSMEELREQLQEWWGETTDSNSRATLLAENLIKGFTIQKDGISEQKYLINEKIVCRNFFLRARGIQNQMLYLQEKNIADDRSSVTASIFKDHVNSTKSADKALKTNEMVAWLRLFADSVGDKMPDEDITVLPYQQIKPIYEEYIDDIQAASGTFGEPLKQTHFYNTFNKVCSTLKLRLARSTGSFVVCTVCDAYHTRMRTVKSLRQRDQLKQMRQAHLRKQANQRSKYYKHKHKASINPSKYLSIIMDGMDQKKTHLPVWSRYTKDESPMEQRLVGVMVHGKRNYAFLVDATVPGGTNLMIEIIRYVLNDLDARGELPFVDPTLYLQVDNCGENKNKVMFGFLTHLVRLSMFRKIKVGFLMVGHTHEDIDQFFSVIAAHLKMPHVICPDIPTFIAEVKNAFSNEKAQPTVIQLAALSIFDYKAIYKDYLDPQLAYHQEPHQFRIKQHLHHQSSAWMESVVLVHYKNWCHSAHWLPTITAAENEIHTSQANVEGATHEQQVQPAKKARKMSRGKSSIGMRCQKSDLLDNNETFVQEANDRFEQNALQKIQYENSFDVSLSLITTPGILWLKDSPPTQNAPLLQFDLPTVTANYAWVDSVVNDILKKFESKYREVFSDNVRESWRSWKVRNQQMWDPNTKSATFGVLGLPRPFAERVPTNAAHEIDIEDSALSDLPDKTETITHSSGQHGSFSKKNRLDMIRDFLSTVHAVRDVSVILTGLGCIYQFVHTDSITKEEKQQIAVGIVEDVRDANVDIRFCPPKGARPQKGKRPDTLYQDIKEDMIFNLSYKSKKGKRVECEDKDLHRSVLLAYNLEMNANGSFSKRPQRSDSIYNASSYAVAASVIKAFYARKK
jgi:hypothetical protein